MNTYSTSSGQRVTQSQIDRNITKAKAAVLQNQIDQYGYNFCVDCKRNASGTRLDCSHDISVKEAKECGKAELSWDVENIKIRCRKCHQELDKLNLQFNNK